MSMKRRGFFSAVIGSALAACGAGADRRSTDRDVILSYGGKTFTIRNCVVFPNRTIITTCKPLVRQQFALTGTITGSNEESVKLAKECIERSWRAA